MPDPLLKCKGGIEHNNTLYIYSSFGVYEYLQNLHREKGEVAAFHQRLAYAGLGGVVGAAVGNFADVINVRMQVME